MAERTTAEAQLQRILRLLPVAARDGGASIAELAAMLGVPDEQVVRDLTEVTAREFYHPAGGLTDLGILIEDDRVEVFSDGHFDRPVQLSTTEAMALAIGFRLLAMETPSPRREELLEHGRALEAMLGVAPVGPRGARGARGKGDSERIAGAESPADELRGAISGAIAGRHPVEIAYLKPEDTAPERRVVEPYALVSAGTHWYLLGRCRKSDAVRAFRLDRVLSVGSLPGEHEIPAGFDPAAYLDEGRVYRAEGDVEVAVRYSPAIAAWVREAGPVEECADGSVVVRMRVADPGWIVRHILEHAPDAELLEPLEWRAMVAGAASLSIA